MDFPYDLPNNIFFTLPDCKNTVYNTYHTRCINQLFTLSASLPVNSRLLVVKFWGSQHLRTNFWWCGESVPLTPVSGVNCVSVCVYSWYVCSKRTVGLGGGWRHLSDPKVSTFYMTGTVLTTDRRLRASSKTEIISATIKKYIKKRSWKIKKKWNTKSYLNKPKKEKGNRRTKSKRGQIEDK